MYECDESSNIINYKEQTEFPTLGLYNIQLVSWVILKCFIAMFNGVIKDMSK